MKIKTVLLVLPKLSSYKYKDPVIQQYIDIKLKEHLEFCDKYKLPITCFAEDMLAVALLKDKKNIQWLSLIGEADKNFLATKVEGYPEQYWELQKECINEELIKSAVKQISVKQMKDYSDKQAYRSDRLNILNKRIRYAPNNILNKEKFIIYLDAKNNYCTFPVVQMGDGRISIYVDIVKDITQYYLGGIPLNKYDFNIIMEGVNP